MNWSSRYINEKYNLRLAEYKIETIGPCLGSDCHHCGFLQDEIKTLTTKKSAGEGKKPPPIPYADKHRAKLLKGILKMHKEGRP